MISLMIKLAFYGVIGLLIWRVVSVWLTKMTGGHDDKRSARQDGVTDMVACPVCHTYVIVGNKTRCGRPNCPGL